VVASLNAILAYDFFRFLRRPQGHKQFLAIEDGVRESTQSWREVLLGLKGRGMNCPQLAIGDGAMGFWSALDEVYPQSKQQRCWVHKTANVLNCVPKSVQPKVKDALHQIWQADTQSNAHQAFDRFEQLFSAKYPKACKAVVVRPCEMLISYPYLFLQFN
jgi:putative transposase